MKSTLFLPLFALLPSLSLASPTQGPEWTNLLADDSTALWKSPKHEEVTPAWSLQEGVLHLDKSGQKRGGHLVTKKHYFDFELRFEWKISPGGNSGVKYRTSNLLGFEFQVIDDQSLAARKDSHRAGSLYDLVPSPADKKLKPVGEWNQSRIIAKGTQIEHWLNGTKVVEIPLKGKAWDERFTKSKYRKIPNFAGQPGPILLQDHGNDVWFRHLFIKEL
ncbi:MAG: 3-keto-disaccharide hydrolase [Verrucomicrobiales bacterium]